MGRAGESRWPAAAGAARAFARSGTPRAPAVFPGAFSLVRPSAAIETSLRPAICSISHTRSVSVRFLTLKSDECVRTRLLPRVRGLDGRDMAESLTACQDRAAIRKGPRHLQPKNLRVPKLHAAGDTTTPSISNPASTSCFRDGGRVKGSRKIRSGVAAMPEVNRGSSAESARITVVKSAFPRTLGPDAASRTADAMTEGRRRRMKQRHNLERRDGRDRWIPPAASRSWTCPTGRKNLPAHEHPMELPQFRHL